MTIDQVVDPPMAKFWDDSDVYKLMLDYYRQRQTHSFFIRPPISDLVFGTRDLTFSIVFSIQK